MLYFMIGALAGLVLARVPAYADKYIERYANHSLPDDYVGPKFMNWKNGEKVND